MFNSEMYQLGSKRSVIRELFEFGKQISKKYGPENVFDFSIGNPSVPTPDEVKEDLIKLLTEKDPMALHGYTSAQGDPNVRKAVAYNLNQRYKTNFSEKNLYMTVGAAASLCICFRSIISKEADEIVTFAPFFYRI